MVDLVAHVGRNIRARALLRPGQLILVAVSGGVDSMVLLELLNRLARNNRWQLKIAHLNHQLRGKSSLADERLVLAVGKKLNIPVFMDRVDVRGLARTENVSIEMAARQARHGFLARIAARAKIRSIAIAHHADDQVEHFFLRLLRGSGTEALAGMKWRSPSPCNPKIEIVRPMLDLPKAELYAYAEGRMLGFREDATNRSPDFLRNRIREELLPLLLKKYRPSLAATVSRVMEILGAENDFIKTAAVEWLGSMKPPFEQLHPALQRRCLHEQLLHWAVDPTFDLIEKLRLNPESAVTVPSDRERTESAHADSGGSVIRSRSGVMRIEKTDPDLRPTEVQMIELTRSDRGHTVFAGTGLNWEVKPNRSGPFRKWQKGREWFDADRVGSPVFLRHWRPGDRFQPIGMSSATKLQDLFVNQKVPREIRHRLIVATTADGGIFWVQNQRISERFKLTRRTKRRLQWSWQPD